MVQSLQWFQFVDVEWFSVLSVGPSHRMGRTPQHVHTTEVVTHSIEANTHLDDSLVVRNSLSEG